MRGNARKREGLWTAPRSDATLTLTSGRSGRADLGYSPAVPLLLLLTLLLASAPASAEESSDDWFAPAAGKKAPVIVEEGSEAAEPAPPPKPVKKAPVFVEEGSEAAEPEPPPRPEPKPEPPPRPVPVAPKPAPPPPPAPVPEPVVPAFGGLDLTDEEEVEDAAPAPAPAPTPAPVVEGPAPAPAGVPTWAKPGVALAKPRLTVLVHAADPSLSRAALALELELRRAHRADERLDVADLEQALRAPVDPDGVLAFADAKLSDARRQLDELETTAAAESAAAAVDRLRKNPAALPSTTPLARAFLYLGAALLLDGDAIRAAASLDRAAALDPSLSAAELPAEVQEALATSHAARETNAPGPLNVHCGDTPCLVSIDGAAPALAPVDATLPPGLHLVIALRRAGGRTAKIVDVRSAERTVAELTLPEEPVDAALAALAPTLFEAEASTEGVRRLAAGLTASHLAVVELVPGEGGVLARAILFDLTDASMAKLPARPLGAGAAAILAVELADAALDRAPPDVAFAPWESRWFWLATGAVVVGGTVAGILIASSGDEAPAATAAAAPRRPPPTSDPIVLGIP